MKSSSGAVDLERIEMSRMNEENFEEVVLYRETLQSHIETNS
jgi:hypothetical protein